MMHRNKCAGSAQLRGSDKKKNGVKIAHERETNSLQSLIGPGKLWQAIMTVIITTTVLVVAIIILVFSPQLFCLPPSEISLAASRGARCLYRPHLNKILRAKKTLNCLTFQNRYIIFSHKAIKAMRAQFPTVLKTGAVFQLDSSLCKTSEHCLPQEYSLHCTL